MDNKTLLYMGLGVGVIYFATQGTGGTSNPLTAILNPGQSTASIPTTYGINSGVLGGDGSYYTVSNYPTLLAANPNLGNPNYQLQPNEIAQYLANYLNLQQGLPSWIGQKDLRGVKVLTLQQAAQEHWTIYGCAAKMIFLPLQPPSTANFIPPPVNKKASSGSWVSTALTTAASIAVAIIGPDVPLNNADAQILFTAAPIMYDLLPMFAGANSQAVDQMHNKLTMLLTDYY